MGQFVRCNKFNDALHQSIIALQYKTTKMARIGSRTHAVAEVSKLELGAVLALYAADDTGCSVHVSERSNLNSGEAL